MVLKGFEDIINNLQKSHTWKIELTIAINFISSKDNDKEHVMHSISDNIEIKINDKADEVIENLELLLNRCQNDLETSMRGSDFIFDCFHLLYYKCHKINFKPGGLYINFPDNKQKNSNKSYQ